MDINNSSLAYKIEVGESGNGSFGGEQYAIEYEIINLDSLNDEISKGLAEVDERLDTVEAKIDYLNDKIYNLTNHSDALDYSAAVISGIIAGMIDSFFVGEFSLEQGREWGTEKVNGFVTKAAKVTGYKGDDLGGAIKHLEKYGAPSDPLMNVFGGAAQHHLRDFAHHPTPVGLFFSMLTQFTEKAYGTNTAGSFCIADITDKTFIGSDLPHKILFGFIYWLLHMASDMAGSSGAIGRNSGGTGLPGPLLSLAKELSALPIFGKGNEENAQGLRLYISKLFNGTALGKRDASGKIIEPLRFDLRAELGVIQQIGKQAVPVIINEVLVRGFYFIRRLIEELRKKPSSVDDIDWKKTLPFKNRTIVRMLTISTGTFTAVDLADAAIRSVATAGATPAALGKFALRVNYVGVGRFAVAVGTDISMGIKKQIAERERMAARSEQLMLLDAKVYYKQAGMWIAAKDAGQAIDKLCEMAPRVAKFWLDSAEDIREKMDNITPQMIENAEKKNPGLINDILSILEN